MELRRINKHTFCIFIIADQTLSSGLVMLKIFNLVKVPFGSVTSNVPVTKLTWISVNTVNWVYTTVHTTTTFTCPVAKVSVAFKMSML